MTAVFGVVFTAHHVGECFRPVVVVVLYAQTPFILAEYPRQQPLSGVRQPGLFALWRYQTHRQAAFIALLRPRLPGRVGDVAEQAALIIAVLPLRTVCCRVTA